MIESLESRLFLAGDITGVVYNDVNANGKREAGDIGVAGRVVFIDMDSDGRLSTGDPSATTDASGNYHFANQGASNHVVIQAPRLDWKIDPNQGGYIQPSTGSDIRDLGGRPVSVSNALDSTFAQQGRWSSQGPFPAGTGPVLARQPDGRILLLQQKLAANYSFVGTSVRRFMEDGTLDLSFGTNGEYLSTLPLRCVTVENDGVILLGGHDPGTRLGAAVRLLPSGKPDPSFGTNGTATIAGTAFQDFYSLLQLPTGDILAGSQGSIYYAITPDGHADVNSNHTVGQIGSHAFESVANTDFLTDRIVLLPNGGFLEAGSYSINFGTIKSIVARFLPDGSRDQSFGTDGAVWMNRSPTNYQWNDVAAIADGSVIVVGASNSQGVIARYTSAGILDPSFGSGGLVTANLSNFTGGTTSFTSVLIDDTGMITVAGQASVNTKSTDVIVARYHVDSGAPDTAYFGGHANLNFSSYDDVALGITPDQQGRPILLVKSYFFDFAVARLALDIYAPKVTLANANLTSAPEQIVLTFSEPLIAAPAAGALQINNLAGGNIFKATAVTYDQTANTLKFSLPAGLIDENYRATLAAGAVADKAGNAMTTAANVDFFILRGDANLDRTVDFKDLVALAQNYGQTGKTSAQGDFDYDTKVGFRDLVILAQQYGTVLAMPSGSVSALASSPVGVASIARNQAAAEKVFRVIPVSKSVRTSKPPERVVVPKA